MSFIQLNRCLFSHWCSYLCSQWKADVFWQSLSPLPRTVKDKLMVQPPHCSYSSSPQKKAGCIWKRTLWTFPRRLAFKPRSALAVHDPGQIISFIVLLIVCKMGIIILFQLPKLPWDSREAKTLYTVRCCVPFAGRLPASTTKCALGPVSPHTEHVFLFWCFDI